VRGRACPYPVAMIDLGRNVTADDVDRMVSKLYITAGADRRSKWSAFWVLLVLASIIASAGIVSDSTATVIGAMIVAPLMTPILGTALALVLADRRHLLHNAGLVLAGATVVVAIGYLVGMSHAVDVIAATNSQVAGRVSPKLIDLVAALATGVVGAFALVRSDVSDTLPGVAIAISLVPPLAVVGLTLESGRPVEAAGALLLFATNVAAIIATGTFVLLAFRVRNAMADAGRPIPPMSRSTVAVVVGAVLVIMVPLAWGTLTAAIEQQIVHRAQPVADQWAEQQGWIVVKVAYQQGALIIQALGSPPEADADALRADLDEAGLAAVDTKVTLVIGGTKEFPAV
jgi:uncharacterized hydrophobic protein (TIGR00271 family)